MQNKNRFWFWSLSLIAIIILTWAIIQIARPGTEGSTITTDQEWIKGNPEAQVTLIEYSDFQCPACVYYYTYIQMLAKEFGDQIQIIYRHYPLDSIHPQASLAAYAAEAAGQQGQFWQMHDMLFDNQDQWSNNNDAENIFISYAQELGLDVETFKNNLQDKNIKQAIQDDKISGNQAFVEGTPTFYLNGKKINNPRSYDKLRQLINEQLSQTK